MKSYIKFLLFFIPFYSFGQSTTHDISSTNNEFDKYLEILFSKKADTIVNIDTSMYQVDYYSMCTGYFFQNQSQFLDKKAIICHENIHKGNSSLEIDPFQRDNSSIDYTELLDSTFQFPYFEKSIYLDLENIHQPILSNTSEFTRIISFENSTYLILAKTYTEPDIKSIPPISHTTVYFLKKNDE